MAGRERCQMSPLQATFRGAQVVQLFLTPVCLHKQHQGTVQVVKMVS